MSDGPGKTELRAWHMLVGLGSGAAAYVLLLRLDETEPWLTTLLALLVPIGVVIALQVFTASTGTKTGPDVWSDILKPGETVLWQGAPDPGFQFRKEYAAGLIIGGAALFMLPVVDDTPLWLWVVVPIFAILAAVISPLWDGYTRRHSFYTLTNKRAFIGIGRPFMGRQLLAYPIGPDTVLRKGKTGEKHAVWIAQKIRYTKSGKVQINFGFESLPADQAEEVHEMIKRLIDGPGGQTE